MTTGEKVKFYRLSKGLSQLVLEIDAGLSEGNISRIENNTVNPTKETLLKIAEVLKLSIQEQVHLFGLIKTTEDNDKILELDELITLTNKLKQMGKTIAFTHGVFDVLHIGHIDLFEKSAELCDFLIVGVDSDENFSYTSSYAKPINNEDTRAKMLARIDKVNAVFIIKEKVSNEFYTKLYHDLNVSTVTIGEGFRARDKIYKRFENIDDIKLVEFKHTANQNGKDIDELIRKKYDRIIN